jgi:hypothetical protein
VRKIDISYQGMSETVRYDVEQLLRKIEKEWRTDVRIRFRLQDGKDKRPLKG